MSKKEDLPKSPIAVYNLGGSMYLMEDHGPRHVVIGANRKGELVTCDSDGVLQPCSPTSEVLRELAHRYNVYEELLLAAEKACCLIMDKPEAYDVLKRAIQEAKADR